jgi:IS5 family transposase
MMLEGFSYRETVVRIAEREFLQDFIRTRKKAVMDHTFLSRAFKAIRPATWKRVNELLGHRSMESETVDPSVIRVDTTVVETNIHWPTDSSLLWDTWRVAARIQRRGRYLVPNRLRHRFHDNKIKGLHLTITRYASSTCKKRQRRVKRAFRTLIERVAWIVGIAEEFSKIAEERGSLELAGLGAELARFLPAMRHVVEQASRREAGATVPAAERVFSIFEPHTELIKRGRRHKPVEFGHAVLLCQTAEKFITDYEVRTPTCRLRIDRNSD